MSQILFPDSPNPGDSIVGPNGVLYTYDKPFGPGVDGVWLATPSGPLSVTAGSISGNAAVGQVLTYTNGVASGGTPPYSLAHEWFVDGIGTGITAQTYTVALGDQGKAITVKITATDFAAATATATTAPINIPVNLTITNPGTITGTPEVNATLNYAGYAAAGGFGTVNFTWVWKITPNTVIPLSANQTSITVPANAYGQKIFVDLLATDSNSPADTATAVTSNFPSSGTISRAAFPTSVWDPLPSNGLNTIPGLVSGLYKGTSTTITPSGCIEVSKNGTSWVTAPATLTIAPNADTLYARWSVSTPCGGAPSNTPITGAVTDGTYENVYNITVNRVPSPALGDITDTNVALGATVSKAATTTVQNINTTAYVTYDGASTGTNIRAATAPGGPFTTLATSGQGFPVISGQTLYIEQTAGTAVNTSPGYTAVIRVGDGTNTAGTYDEFTYFAQTVATATFPNFATVPAGGPNASPDTTALTGPALFGIAVGNPWADGTTSISTTGSLEYKIGAGSWGQAGQTVNNGNVVSLRWNAAAALAANNLGSLTGTLTNGVYTNSYTLSVAKLPAAYDWGDQTGAAKLTQVVSSPITISSINCPARLTYTPDTTFPLTSVEASINGGTWTAIPTSAPGLVVDPADSLGTTATTILIRGTTGNANLQDYSITTQIGDGTTSTDKIWTVRTTNVPDVIATPSITAPTGTNNNPAVFSPAGLTVTGSLYTITSGSPGVHNNSDWEVFGGLTNGTRNPQTSGIVSTVAGSAGTSGTIQYKNANTADPNPALAQNVVYGEIPQDNALAAGQPAGTYPLFEWAAGLNTANFNGFNDWYIPAKNELEILYFNLKPTIDNNVTTSGINPNAVPARGGNYSAGGPPNQTTATLFQGTNAQALSTSSYWSATQDSSSTANAWTQGFFNGGVTSLSKPGNSYARVIRRIPIAQYTAAGSPAIGSILAGGFYAGQISTTANGVADYALIVAPKNGGEYQSTPGVNASITLTNTTDLASMQPGDTVVEVGGGADASGVILSINLAGPTITFASSTGTWTGGVGATAKDTSRTISVTAAPLISTNTISLVTQNPAVAWANQTSGTTDQFGAIINVNGLFVAVGGEGAVYTSPDGSTWTNRATNLGPTYACYSIAYGNGRIIVPVISGNTPTFPDRIRYSDDGGLTWQSVNLPAGQNVNGGAAFGNGLFVVASPSGQILTSTDGLTWTPRTSGWTQNAARNGTYFGNGLFVVTGGDGSQIVTSPDGINWTTRSTGISSANFLYGGTYANGLYTILGSNGAYATSTNGTTWSATTIGPGSNLYGITCTGGQWVAVGALNAGNGTILTSTNGTTWTQVSNSTGQPLFCVAAAGTKIVAAGNNGRIATSTASSTVLTIAGADADGFLPGNTISNGVIGASAASGVITAISGTSVTVTPGSANWANGQNLYMGVPIVDVTGDTINLTSYFIPQASLTPSSTYYARVKYSSLTTSSNFSPWASFGTSSSFVLQPGEAYGGGYFAGQIRVFAGQEGPGVPAVDTVYNLIIAPLEGNTSGPATGGALKGETTTSILYKTSNTNDSTADQNQVYGGTTSDLYKASGVHPLFNTTWLNNSAGPNGGTMNLATGGLGGGAGIGGYTDWYVPAKNELEILFYNLRPETIASFPNNTSSGINPNAVPPRASNYAAGGPPTQTTSNLFKTAGGENFRVGTGFWSSSESSSVTGNAWVQTSNSLSQTTVAKNTPGGYARAVRRVQA